MDLDLQRSGPWIGAGGLFVMLWLVVSTVLYAPWWGVLLHLVVLAAFVPRLVRLSRDRPVRATWVPLEAFAAWVAVNALGVVAFSWSF
ncbi:hypothetical protein ASD11_04605 [Aeromicrobium sp. Root495]|uniref:hypothetical protein n=1 Tax=Aeromicrobium sp. Root495 TaxID=1736550 RepID=UPI0006F45EDD|nr:hypothetical protein [Aeromicrobium sp. Root495]KQY58913.1 hypothetical protein ASD11_04605 [Aeromicrobium sp. Root495]RYJ07370.1 MAG: hypothetical protein EON52_01595 [Actinomycetales bacterium]